MELHRDLALFLPQRAARVLVELVVCRERKRQRIAAGRVEQFAQQSIVVADGSVAHNQRPLMLA